MPQKTLFINTATAQTTIALFNEAMLIAEKRWASELNEADKLQPAVDELLRTQGLQVDDIQGIIVCVGPGGFTSVRVGVSAVNAWAFAKQIHVAEVSVFDLYESEDLVLVLSTNATEAWIKIPGKDPEFLSLEQVQLPSTFRFGGIVQDAWKEALLKRGGTFEDLDEKLPDIKKLHFEEKIVKPWYYKDAKITWSEKNSKSIKK